MHNYAFKEKFGLEVNRDIYDLHWHYPYVKDATGRWCGPRVRIQMLRTDNYDPSPPPVEVLVDTGAYICILSEATTKRLGIENSSGSCEIATDIGGDPIIVLRRQVRVFLGGVLQTLAVGVAPSRTYLRALESRGEALGRPPKDDVLGTSELLASNLLCFDAERLYVFPKRPQQHRRT